MSHNDMQPEPLWHNSLPHTSWSLYEKLDTAEISAAYDVYKLTKDTFVLVCTGH